MQYDPAVSDTLGRQAQPLQRGIEHHLPYRQGVYLAKQQALQGFIYGLITNQIGIALPGQPLVIGIAQHHPDSGQMTQLVQPGQRLPDAGRLVNHDPIEKKRPDPFVMGSALRRPLGHK